MERSFSFKQRSHRCIVKVNFYNKFSPQGNCLIEGQKGILISLKYFYFDLRLDKSSLNSKTKKIEN